VPHTTAARLHFGVEFAEMLVRMIEVILGREGNDLMLMLFQPLRKIGHGRNGGELFASTT